MHLTESGAEPVEQLVGHGHRRIDRPRVCDVEAEACVGQLLKEGLNLVGGAAGAFPVVHVLEHQPRSKGPICVWIREGIRVRDDRSHPDRELGELLNEHRCFQPLMFDRCVNADVAERQAWLGQEVPDEPGQLGARKRLQLDGEGGDPARLVDKLRPVAARSFKDAGRDADRMVVGECLARCISGRGGQRAAVSRAADDQRPQEPKTGTTPIPK